MKSTHTPYIYTVIPLLLLILSVPTFAQMPIKHDMVEQLPPDSIDLAEANKKHFWRASAEVVGFNLGLWAFDRYVQHGDFSYISWNTVKENFRHGFIWDNDKLGTNTFLHPYNGNLYYTAGRANGFNFWQSELFAIAGSGMWEMFMENEYPSTNDIIATPIGGAVLGETLYRASDAILDDRTSGSERFGREAAAFILSPMRGINRLITGKAWRKSATPGRTFGTPQIALQASLGVNTMVFAHRFSKPYIGGVFQLDLEYGDRFEAKSTKPYDYFTLRAEIQGMKYQPVLSRLQIKGRLLSREILDNYRTSASIGLYQHFDFYDSDTITNIDRVPYKLGIPASLGAGIMFRDIERHQTVLDAYLHVNGVILGSILSDHYWTDERNYNWASGFSIKAGVNLVLKKNIASFSLNNEYYRLFTWSGYRTGTDLKAVNFRTLNVQGDKSNAFFNVTELRADLRIARNLYATLNYLYKLRHTNYRDFPHVESSTSSMKFMMTYKF